MSSALFQKDSFTFFKFKETSQRENAILLKGRFQISHEKILCFDSMGNKAAVFLIPDDTLYLKLLWAFNDSCKIDTMSIGSTYVRNSKYDTSGHIEWGLVMRSFNRKTLLPSKFWVYSYYPNHDEKAKSNFKNGKLQGRQYYYTPVRSYTDSSYFMFTAIEGKWKKGRKNGTWLYYEPVVKHWGIEEFPITDIDRRPIRKELYRKGILKHSWVPK